MEELNQHYVNDQYERTLYICNFDEKVDKELLQEIFIQAGPLESVTVREKYEKTSIPGRIPEKFRFAFVEFTHVESKEIYTQNGMKEKSFELHHEKGERRERNRSDNFEKNKISRYPNQPTPSNQLVKGISNASWSAPISSRRSNQLSHPLDHFDGRPLFSPYEDLILPLFIASILPPPPPPPLFNETTPQACGSHKTLKNSKQQRSRQWNKFQSSYRGHSDNKNRNSQPQRHSWPRLHQLIFNAKLLLLFPLNLYCLFIIYQSNGRKATRTHTFVSNFDEKVDKELLYEIFIQAGPLESVVILEKYKKKSPGKFPEKFRYAFVEFTHLESVSFACKIMNGIELFGKKLKFYSTNYKEKQKLIESFFALFYFKK
ncbi:RRM domain-containing protein [Meloidogyne graminicola]|uniref:RRM domain-containing protein n=1 Tax=Meloidogyne graminicola TaxID=189291 RepID=A0A8S9ZN45_9BILA|nr:RRM domain-containing protein [Meloidogyne graminicola]